jgi:hypothetical protein
VRIGWTDAWDDHLPTGCRANPGTAQPQVIHGTTLDLANCQEGLHTWNQTRPAVFDGGYAFGYPAGEPTCRSASHIIEALTPPGLQIQREEDLNVIFGNVPTPAPELVPPECVGADHNRDAGVELPR